MISAGAEESGPPLEALRALAVQGSIKTFLATTGLGREMLAKNCNLVAGGLGLDIDLRKIPVQGVMVDDRVLYSESAGRFVVTVSPKNRIRFEQLLQDAEFGHIGSVTENNEFKVTGMKGTVIIQDSIEKLKEAWQSTFRGF